MKKLVLLSLVLVLGAGMAFATASSEEPEDLVEIEWLHRAGSRTEQFGAVVDAFNASQSRAVINIQHVSDGYNELLQTQFLAGDGPDMFTHKGSEIPQFSEAGWMLDISNEAFADRFDPAALSVFTYKGGLYSLPFETKGWGLWVNDDMFAAAGAQVPTTIDEFIEVCELFRSAGVEPVATGYFESWYIGQSVTYGVTSFLVPWIQANRAVYDAGEFTFDTEEMREFIPMLEAIREYAPAAAADMEPDDCLVAFANGEFPMLLAGEWSVFNVRGYNADINATVNPLPVSNRASAAAIFPASYGDVHFGPDIDKPAMRAFVDFWFDDGPIMKEYFEAVGLAPLISNYTVEINIDPLVDVTSRMAKEGNTIPTYQYFDPPGSRSVVWSEVQAWFLDDEATPDDLIETLDDVWFEYWEAGQ